MSAREDSGQGEEEDDDGEEEEEEEEGDDDEFIDVLDILDGRGEPDLGDDGDNASRSDDKNTLSHKNTLEEDLEWNGIESGANDEKSDDEDSSDEEEEGEDEDVIISGDEEETDPDALEALGNFVSKLETSAKRKADDEDDGASSASQLKKKKQKILRDRTEAGKEGEFGARAAGMSSTKSKSDLLTTAKVQAC